MHINGAYSHDFLPVTLGELPNQHGNEGVQLGHLLLVIFLHRVLVAFLHPGEGNPNLGCPPDLGAGKSHLGKWDGSVSGKTPELLYVPECLIHREIKDEVSVT